ncbi:hypothetical protein Rhopal_000206-T1 [Rhodotorula paludigena]|uniref:F-box domain-containing protein n=1 Tax=Rhodotorula paludigena TaxID=86838 RepID=A0AAV5GA97_9BASI|nr:hypothetical protein Rhopal_000206-T1 [Rhodotorula paludigena]
MVSPRAEAPYLPPELISSILSTSSKPTLLSASLVSRDWRGPSQDLLESRLSLPTSKAARAWLACPGRKTRTRRLSLGSGLSIDECWEVFDSCDALEELALVPDPSRARAKFDLRALQSPKLKNLAPAVPWPLPFSLKTLTCKGLYHIYPKPIVAAIAASSRTTLVELDLDCYGSNASARAFMSAFRPATECLQSMEIHGADRHTPLLPFIASCRVLSRFACWEATPALLSALPATVTTLEIGKTIFHSDAPYEDMFARANLLAQLKRVRWGGISRATLRAQIGGNELLEECRERDIEVEFGVVRNGGLYGSYGWPICGAK